MKSFLKFNNLLLIIFFAACAQRPSLKKTTDRLFPDGVYTQNIQLKLFPNTKNQNNLPMRTVVKTRGTLFELVGLTPFGTTAFEAKGDLKKPDAMEIRFAMERPPGLKDSFIKKTLLQIQGFQHLKQKDLKRNAQYDWVELKKVRLEIFSYQKDGIPSQMRLKAKHWVASVYTESFKPLKVPGT